jgi:hypothetical protein
MFVFRYYAVLWTLLGRVLCQCSGEKTVVSIGFGMGENYLFVSSTPNAQAQIFQYIPQLVAYALQIDLECIKKFSLAPIETRASLGYITTALIFAIPSDKVEVLQGQLDDPTSRVFSNPDEDLRKLLSTVNFDMRLDDPRTSEARQIATISLQKQSQEEEEKRRAQQQQALRDLASRLRVLASIEATRTGPTASSQTTASRGITASSLRPKRFHASHSHTRHYPRLSLSMNFPTTFPTRAKTALPCMTGS